MVGSLGTIHHRIHLLAAEAVNVNADLLGDRRVINDINLSRVGGLGIGVTSIGGRRRRRVGWGWGNGRRIGNGGCGSNGRRIDGRRVDHIGDQVTWELLTPWPSRSPSPRNKGPIPAIIITRGDIVEIIVVKILG